MHWISPRSSISARLLALWPARARFFAGSRRMSFPRGRKMSWAPRLRSIYIAFGGIALVLVLVYLAGRWASGWAPNEWPDVWMPPLIAEWIGLSVAVLIVERLLKRTYMAPLRREAGAAIGEALWPIEFFAVGDFVAEG